MSKPNQPDAEDEIKKKNLEGHQDDEEQDDEDEESEEEGSGKKGDKGEEEDSESDDEDTSQWSPEQTKDYVKKLRKENARYRKERNASKTEVAELRKQITGVQNSVAKVLGLKDGEELTPEEQAEALSGQLGAQQFQTAVLEAAYSYGVPPDSRDYFEYLVQKQVAALDEGEELDEEALEAIAQKAKGAGKGKRGFSTSITKGAGRQSDDDESDDDSESDGSDPKPSKGQKGLTAERFAEMGTIEKTNLYSKNPQLFERLMAEARRKNLLKTF